MYTTIYEFITSTIFTKSWQEDLNGKKYGKNVKQPNLNLKGDWFKSNSRDKLLYTCITFKLQAGGKFITINIEWNYNVWYELPWGENKCVLTASFIQ